MNYIFKLIISQFVEILILLFYLQKIFTIFLFKFIGIYKLKPNHKDHISSLDLLVFKSGTMGDHLICIDCLDKLPNLNFKLNKIIICRKKSIFPEILNFGKKNQVNLYSYKFLIKLFLKNLFNNKVILIVDSEPNFRIGLLFGLIMQNAIISSNLKSPLDQFFNKFYPRVSYNVYDENLNEGKFIITLINNVLNIFSKNSKNRKLSNIKINDYENQFLSFKPKKNHKLGALIFHDKFIDNKDYHKRKPIYIYYGCSGKAMHRIPPLNWFENFEKLLHSKYFLYYVGGPSEMQLKNTLRNNVHSSFEFINKFSISDWSLILCNSKYNFPLLSFDGGFSHIFGIHSPFIFQVFCSSNNYKWRNKSKHSFVYSCLDGGSPIYKPYKFQVPDECLMSQNAWKSTNQKDVFNKFNYWVNSF